MIADTALLKRQLKDSKANMQAILDHSTEGFVLADLDGTIRMINKSAKSTIFLNRNEHAGEGDNLFDYITPMRRIAFGEFFKRVGGGETVKYERSFERTNQEKVWFEFELSPVTEDGCITAVCMRGRDVTYIREGELLQRKLEAEKLNKQKYIARATIHAQESQRSEIGRELHDNINQMLASVKLFLNYAVTHKTERLSTVHKSIEILNDCTEEIRRLSSSLVPPSLGNLGLKETIRDLIDTVVLTGMHVQCTGLLLLNESFLSVDLQLSIYRILQEQLNNINKHAGASMIIIAFRQSQKFLLMDITDNGSGFDVQAKRRGIGITNILNRAAVFNGKVDIISAPDKGTTLKVRFLIEQ